MKHAAKKQACEIFFMAKKFHATLYLLVPRCPPLLYGAALSTPAMAVSTFSMVPRCQVSRFQSRVNDFGPHTDSVVRGRLICESDLYASIYGSIVQHSAQSFEQLTGFGLSHITGLTCCTQISLCVRFICICSYFLYDVFICVIIVTQ